MRVTEAERLHLFKSFEGILPPQALATLMTMLPPDGWTDLATKQDLELVRVDLRREIAELRAVLLDDSRAQTTRFVGWMMAGNTALAGLFGTLVALT